MKKLFFSLLRYAVWDGGSVDTEEAVKALPQLYSLAKKHDLGQLLAYALERLGISDEGLTRERDIAVFRVEKIKYTSASVSDLLTEAGLRHMLLKGEYVRRLYPEEWLRPSCDVDVYVDPAEVERASSVLESAGYVKGRRHTHDIVFTSPSGCTVELHFSLAAEGYQKKASEILRNVWEHTVRESEYRFRLNDEMAYFYHVSHMARHVQTGGCGIRPFIDMKLLKCDRARVESLLEAGGLSTFEKIAGQLADVWFFDGCHNGATELLEEYVLSGEVYGKSRNAVAGSGSRIGYIASRIFMPYSQLKLKYPSLDGRPYLMPVYTVKRWCNLLKGRKLDSSVGELRATRTVSEEETRKYGTLFKKLGL